MSYCLLNVCTGGAGFIASHVCIRLCREYPDYKVSSLSRFSTSPCVHVHDAPYHGVQVAGKDGTSLGLSNYACGWLQGCGCEVKCLSPSWLKGNTTGPSVSQIVVVDKLDYCASKHNLDKCRDHPHFKVPPCTDS